MNVLIVEDSSVVRQLLRFILEEGGLTVIGEATNGEEALKFIQRQRPDVITMDIHMPKMDGYECTRRIMETTPIPIVVVTGSYNIKDSEFALRLLDVGAVTVVEKPLGVDHPAFEADATNLLKTVKNIGQIKVVRRTRPSSPKRPGHADQEWSPKLVVIGASTGGPVALKALLSAIERPCPWPTLIVQHITPGFLPGFCEWLYNSSKLPVQIAEHGERAHAGQVYVAPDGVHMEIDADMTIRLVKPEVESNLCPSVDALFASVAQHWGRHALAILLSGMGKDGVRELVELKKRGALTLVQDADTAVIYGMPGEAVNAGAASRILPPDAMAGVLNKMAGG